MTFDHLLHLIATERLTPRQYARVMRRFRKGLFRGVGLALPLLPLHLAGTSFHIKHSTPYSAVFGVLAGLAGAAMLMSVLGMLVAWVQSPRRNVHAGQPS